MISCFFVRSLKNVRSLVLSMSLNMALAWSISCLKRPVPVIYFKWVAYQIAVHIYGTLFTSFQTYSFFSIKETCTHFSSTFFLSLQFFSVTWCLQNVCFLKCKNGRLYLNTELSYVGPWLTWLESRQNWQLWSPSLSYDCQAFSVFPLLRWPSFLTNSLYYF